MSNNGGYTIAAENVSEANLRKFYEDAKKVLGVKCKDLDLIFEIALKDRKLFPNINLKGNDKNPKNYIDRWVKGYSEARNNLPHRRIAKPKSTCNDPAITVMVRVARNMTEQQSNIGVSNHNLFMSAENIQGNLLEEYIALKIRPYGFLWCNGNVLHAIDFCNSNGSFFLQVKNKSNTENSSSDKIREGTTIEKWYRLGTKICNGVKVPDFKWDSLNGLIKRHRTEGADISPCNMSEEDYQNFLKNVALENRELITDL